MLNRRLRSISVFISAIVAAQIASALPNDDHLTKTHSLKKAHAEPLKQTWNFQNADIRAVINTVSQLTGKSFIIDPRVQGKITLVSNKPMGIKELYQSFLSMLQVLNYSAIPAGRSIKIVPSMDARGYGGTLVGKHHPGKGDQVVVRVVPVNNVSAEQLVPILQPMMLSWGSVSAYQPSNSLILTGTANSINQLVNIVHNLDSGDGSRIKVVHLRYADAKKVAQIVQSLQSANSSQGRVNNVAIVADEENNTLLVSGNRDNRDRAIRLIKQMDTKNASGGNNTVVIHLNYLTAKKIAPMLTKLAHGYIQQQKKARSSASFGVGSSNSSVSIQPELSDNAVVMSGPHAVIQSLKGIIKKLDIRPQEVLVQAIIVKVDESKMNQFGIQWGMMPPKSFVPPDSGGGSIPTTFDPSGSGYVNVMPNMGGAMQQAFTAGVGYLTYGRLQAVVTALNKSGNANILATPSVLVLNNQKAEISDGKNVGVANRTYAGTSSGGVYPGYQQPFNSVERKDVTLSLQVTPQIAPDNTVRLEIKQKNDSLDSSANTQDPENPTINTSKINTSVLVNSGDVLVLGGLISDDAEENVSKVPILGDIPLLGRLFTNKSKTVEKKNLMIFIRPIIINNRKQAKKVTENRYNYMRYQEQRKQAGLGLDGSGEYPMLPAHKDSHGPQLPSPFSSGGDK